MDRCSVSKATLGRLPRYLEHLKSVLETGNEYVSSTAIAKSLLLGEVQVRKDLNAVSGAGRPKIGYAITDLITSIEDVLGCNHHTKAIIVGAGKLGQALLNFEGFEEYGIQISAAFDLTPKPMDEFHREVYSMTEFESFCTSNKVKIGIITVSESSAQSVCDLMVKTGIKAIWNFTPTKLSVPTDVLVKQENLALSIAHLNNQSVN